MISFVVLPGSMFSFSDILAQDQVNRYVDDPTATSHSGLSPPREWPLSLSV